MLSSPSCKPGGSPFSSTGNEREEVGRGGPRKGSGRKPKGRAGIVWHVRRDRFRKLTVGHVTMRVREGVRSLRSVVLRREIQRGFAHACDRPGFRLVQYSILDDHVHLVVEAEDHEALACGMKAVGSRLARSVQRVTGWRGRVMLGRYHLQRLTSPKQVRNALRYMLLNRRKHAAKDVRKLRDQWLVDPASSGRAFEAWVPGTVPAVDLVAVRKELGVARARSWLLSAGWQRHHPLISPHEVPA